MKKAFLTLFILALAVTPASFAWAAATPATVTEADLGTTNTQTSLTIRKQTTTDDLQTMLSRLLAVHTRTQLATNSLTANGADTTAVQTILSNATANFTQAKLDIDLFIKTPVTTEKGDNISTLRNNAKKAEDDIRLGRNQLSQAILALKTIITE